MPFKISLDLTPIARIDASAEGGVTQFRAADFRLHGGADLAEKHWLLRHPYGRELLRDKLREVRPDVRVHRYRTPPEVEVLLDGMIDYMDLREWPEPKTVAERVRSGLMLLRYGFSLGRYTMPSWRDLYAQGAPQH